MRFVRILGVAAVIGGVAAASLWRSDSANLHSLSGHNLRGAYFVPNDTGRAALHLIVQSGETVNQGTQGMPHYVEHLAWLNSISADEMLTDRHSNAMTSHRATEYFIHVPADSAAEALATLAKTLNPLPADNDFMASERDIILREYDLYYVDAPLNEAIDDINALSYAGDPLARSVIGTRAEIAAFTLDEARAWHSATHRPDNAVLVVSGSLTKSDAAAMVAQVFSGQGAPTNPQPTGFQMGKIETIIRRRVDARFDQPLINMQVISEINPPLDYAAQRAQLSLLYDILDSTLPGSYARPLRFDAQIAQSYSFQLFALSDRHYEVSFVAARPDAGVDLETLHAGLTRALAGGAVPKDTFERVKERWLKRVLAEDPAEQTLALALESARLRQLPVDSAAYQRAARAVTLDDITRFTRAFAGDTRTIVDMISPK